LVGWIECCCAEYHKAGFNCTSVKMLSAIMIIKLSVINMPSVIMLNVFRLTIGAPNNLLAIFQVYFGWNIVLMKIEI